MFNLNSRWNNYIIHCKSNIKKLNIKRFSYFNFFNNLFDIIILLRFFLIIYRSFNIKFNLLLLVYIMNNLKFKLLYFIKSIIMFMLDLKNFEFFFKLILKFSLYILNFFDDILKSFFLVLGESKLRNSFVLTFDKLYFCGLFISFTYEVKSLLNYVVYNLNHNDLKKNHYDLNYSFVFFKIGNTFLQENLKFKSFFFSKLGLGKHFKFIDSRGLFFISNQAIKHLKPIIYRPRIRRSWEVNEYMYETLKNLHEIFIANFCNRNFFKKTFFFIIKIFSIILPLIKRLIWRMRRKHLLANLRWLSKKNSAQYIKKRKLKIFKWYLHLLYSKLFVYFYLRCLKNKVYLNIKNVNLNFYKKFFFFKYRMQDLYKTVLYLFSNYNNKKKFYIKLKKRLKRKSKSRKIKLNFIKKINSTSTFYKRSSKFQLKKRKGKFVFIYKYLINDLNKHFFLNKNNSL